VAVPAQCGEAPFFLALDSIQDPQNLGSLLRTAEAVGIHGVILPDRRAAGITPAASRASAGAAEHLHVAQVTNLVRTLEALKEAGVWIVGGEEHPQSVDYRRPALNLPVALVLGSEGQGMRRLVAETCDLLLRIPMRGQVGSLNVSVAGGILLYHLLAARQSAT
jgi:23S rRNA (guanosine2251-2'-O)-methyltransferase